MNPRKPFFVVIVIQAIYCGMFLLSKAAFSGGMNTFVFVFYRQAFATVFLAPLALFLEWKAAPPLSFATFFKIFMLSLIGITTSLNINGIALDYTSASIAAATTNSLPVITFVFALLLRMEALKMKSASGVAKLMGVATCTAGVLTLALYHGPSLKLTLCPFHPTHHPFVHRPAAASHSWIKGCFLMLTSNTLWALWMVLQISYMLVIASLEEAQVKAMKNYPSKLCFTALQCLLSSVQSFLVAIALERDLSKWKLGWNVGLLAVLYCGCVVTGVSFYMQSWVIEKKGPVFLAMSTPLALIFTMISSILLLCESLSVGSILGGILLIIGLYSVLWGKSREQAKSDNCSLGAEAHNGVLCTDIKVVESLKE